MTTNNYILCLFFIIYLCCLVNSQQLPDGFCPSPLVYVNTTDRIRDTERGYSFIGETKCVQPCPSLIYSESDWKLFMNSSLYMGGISLFCSLFLVITYSPLVNKKHNRHTLCILFLFMGLFIMNSSNGRVFWNNNEGYFDRICPEEGRFARQTDAYCIAMGIFYQFGILTSVLWWTTLSLDIWLTIKKVKISKAQIYWYVGIVNSIVIFLTFIPLAGQEYGASPFSIGCWVMDIYYQVFGFWLPLGVCLTASSVFISLIIYEIYKSSGTVKKKLLARHLKPIILVFLILIEFFYVFIFITHVLNNRGKYTEDITEYITCILMNIGNPESDSICKVKRRVPAAAQFLFFFFPRLMGFEAVIFYGFTRQTKRVWLRSFWLKNKIALKLLSSMNLSSSSNSSSTTNTNDKHTPSHQISSQQECYNDGQSIELSDNCRNNQ